jgi:ketosteroid isomerase-like protein
MKKNIAVWAIACLTLIFIYNSSNAQTSQGADLVVIRKAIERSNALYFDLYSKNNGSIISLYTEDACLLIPNEPAKCGKQALAKDFKDTYAAGKIRGVKFTTVNVYGDGKLYVTEEGTWQVFDPKGKVLDDGKYLKLWRKTSNGWKIFRDCFNSNHNNQ